MIKTKYATAKLCLVLVLVMGLSPKLVRADGNDTDTDRPIRLYASAGVGPIGKVESFGTVLINGRVSRDEPFIWGGELLQAPNDRSIRVSLGSIGQVTLNGGAMAKLAVTPKRFDDNAGGSVLIASLVRGDVIVKLREHAEAYVEASGSALRASRGASFRVGVSESGPLVDTMVGVVSVESQTRQAKYNIRFVGRRPTIDVRQRQSREVQVMVTDENDKPVPDIPVILTISGTGATLGTGATAVTVTTSATGVASTSISGTAVGTSSLTATISGTTISTTVGVTTAAAAGIITGTTIAIAAGVAAGTAATVVVVNKVKDKKEIEPAGGPKITPTSQR